MKHSGRACIVSNGHKSRDSKPTRLCNVSVLMSVTLLVCVYVCFMFVPVVYCTNFVCTMYTRAESSTKTSAPLPDCHSGKCVNRGPMLKEYVSRGNFKKKN